MRTTKITAAAALTGMLLLLPVACFADVSSCQKLEPYFGKSNEEIKALLLPKNDAQLRDAEDYATRCKRNVFVDFSLTDGTAADSVTAKETAQKVIDARNDLTNDTAQQKDTLKDTLKDFNFAVGLGAHYLTGSPDVLEHSVDNGVLRITNEEKYKLGLWLSTNTFLDTTKFCAPLMNSCIISNDAHKIRWGFFVATQLGNSSNSGILNSLAVGLSFMANHTRSDYVAAGTAPLVFQLGYGLTRIQTLADGYTNGMTLPAGTNQPVMKKSIGKGPVLLVSTAF